MSRGLSRFLVETNRAVGSIVTVVFLILVLVSYSVLVLVALLTPTLSLFPVRLLENRLCNTVSRRIVRLLDL
jgi:hypothetical protein